MTKTQKEKELEDSALVLKSYRIAGETDELFSSLTGFAEYMGVSKQTLNNWMQKKGKPAIEWLQQTAIDYVGEPQGEMAVDMLKRRFLVVPCVCQTEIGDHGPCPKHGIVQVSLKVKKAVAEVLSHAA
jgi:hypothetical protein